MNLVAAFMLSLLVAGTSFAAGREDVVRLSEPVEATPEYETFGAPMDFSVAKVALKDIAVDGDRYIDKAVRVETRVSKVCKKKGCFFIAQQGNSVVRVSFKDYGFFVPTDITGKQVMLVGQVVANELTPEKAKHLAEDLGESEESVEPGREYTIVASSVRVPLGS
ncbi:MAG: DUF4920 domain-containing protein [Woeseiaceae bacterium]|nr:DUF4920 domain-containing protein [Woeseiaceae bacterium]